MAHIDPSSLINGFSGKFSKNERIVYRTHAYVLANPYKGELSDAQKEVISLFAQATELCKTEMQDSERLEFWKEEYKQHLKLAHKHSSDSAFTTYSTLRGFIIASLIKQLKNS